MNLLIANYGNNFKTASMSDRRRGCSELRNLRKASVTLFFQKMPPTYIRAIPVLKTHDARYPNSIPSATQKSEEYAPHRSLWHIPSKTP